MNYTGPTQFEWNEAKSEACAQTRHFNFAYAARVFFDANRLVKIDVRHSYGEERYQVIGKIEGRLFVVVYTPRQNVVRIISARKANQREIRVYENRAQKD
jgi:uncharacterized DUF497 family protein